MSDSEAKDASEGAPARRGVREARSQDLDRITELWIAITDHHRGLDPVFELRPDVHEEIRGLLRTILNDPDSLILVYDVDGDLHGLCIVRIDHSPPIMRETRRAEVTDLGVRAASRRQGIASYLLDVALAWIKHSDVERVEVQVATGNREGQAFWRARGFGDLMDVLHKRL